MNAQQTKTMERLLKKLSALRATLSDEESAMLDRFIISPDVSAHRFDGADVAQGAAGPHPAPRDVEAHIFDAAHAAAGANPAPRDVEAHIFDAAHAAAGANPAPRDVEAHIFDAANAAAGANPAPRDVEAHVFDAANAAAGANPAPRDVEAHSFDTDVYLRMDPYTDRSRGAGSDRGGQTRVRWQVVLDPVKKVFRLV